MKIYYQQWSGGIEMEKFKIPKTPNSTNKCIRFPNWLIQEVEKVLVQADCNFTTFVVEAVRVAVINANEELEERKQKVDGN